MGTFQLSPEDADRIKKAAAPTGAPVLPAPKVNAQGVIEEDPMASRLPDRQLPASPYLAPQNDGSNYAPGGSNNPYNMDLYDKTGDPFLGTPIRTKKITDEKGNEQRQFVMPPNLSNSNTDLKTGTFADPLINFMIPAAKATARVGLNAATKMAKGTASFGEWLLDESTKASNELDKNPELKKTLQGVNPMGVAGIDTLKQVAEFADSLLGTKIADPNTNYTDEEFPTMPTANGVEDFLGTGAAMVWGGSKGKDAGEFVGKELPDFWKRATMRFKDLATEIDPNSADSKVKQLTTFITKVTGEAAGATVATPNDTEPLMGSHFIDNLVLTGGFGVLGKSVGSTGKWIDENVLGGFTDKTKPENVLAEFIKKIDANARTASPEQLAERAKIFADIAAKNSTFDTMLTGVVNGTIELDTATAMTIKDAAKQYVERAYGAVRKGQLPDEVLNDMADTDAQAIVNELRSFKKGRIQAASPVVEHKDLQIGSRVQNLLTEKADNMRVEGDVHSGMQSMVQPQVNELQSARNLLKDRTIHADQAAGELENAQMDNAFTQNLVDAQKKNALGFDAESKNYLLKLGKEQLVSAWKKAKEHVDTLYKAIPKKSYDVNALADSIIASGDMDVAGEAFGLVPLQKTVKSFAGEGANPVEVAASAAQRKKELVNALLKQYPDANSLWNAGRSYLAKRINEASTLARGETSPDVSQLREIEQAIRDVVGSDQDPAIQAATKAYKEFADTWLQTKPLQDFDAAMLNVRDVGDGYTKGNLIAQKAGFNAAKQAFDDPSNTDLMPLLKAAGETQGDAQQYVIGLAMSKAAEAIVNGKFDSKAIIAQLKPLHDMMYNVNSRMADDFGQAISVLQNAELGTVQANEAVRQATVAATRLMSEAADKQTSRWIDNLLKTDNPIGDVSPSFTSNSRAAFTELFQSKEAAGKIPELIKQADATGDPMISQGIRSQYLRFLKEKGMSNNAIGVDVTGGELSFPKGPRPGQLSTMFDSSKDNTINTIKAVFPPDEADVLINVFDFLNTKANMDTAKVFTKGSDTAVNKATAEASARAISKLTVGPLSRLGTRVNTVIKMLLGGEEKAQVEGVNTLMDMFITDPYFLKKIADKGKVAGGVKLIEPMLEGLVTAAKVGGFGLETGVKSIYRTTTPRNKKESGNDSLDQQTQDMLNDNDTTSSIGTPSTFLSGHDK